MATKVYGIYGRTTVEINLPVGKAMLPLTFERGCLDRKNFRPATYITSKKYIQDMIENSNLFGKSIKLVKVYGNEPAVEQKSATKAATVKKQSAGTQATTDKGKKAAETSKAESTEETVSNEPEGNADGITDYPDVTSKEEAIAVLKSLGAKATDFKDEDALPALMAKYKVTFSNFSL